MAYGRPIPSNEHATFICTKCGKQYHCSSYAVGGKLPKGTHAPQIPVPTAGGKCPDTSTGNHIWEQMN